MTMACTILLILSTASAVYLFYFLSFLSFLSCCTSSSGSSLISGSVSFGFAFLVQFIYAVIPLRSLQSFDIGLAGPLQQPSSLVHVFPVECREEHPVFKSWNRAPFQATFAWTRLLASGSQYFFGPIAGPKAPWRRIHSCENSTA